MKTAIDLNKEKYIPSIYRLYYRLHLAFRSWHHVGARRYRQLRNKVGVYAKATNISEKLVWKRLKSGKTMPTSMTALILHDKSGTAKAVLVIDSCSAQVCLEPTDDKFRKHLKALREKLEAFGAYHD